MKKELFKNTSLRLAATYLAVVMLVSGVFSAVLYKVVAADIDRNYNRSMNFVNRIDVFRPDPAQRMLFLQDREDDRDLSRQRLINELLIINLSILVFGGVLCYWLARRTLQPIEEAHESLERFTSDASHELRTPLATMRAEIEVALMNEKLSASEARGLLTSNLEEVDRLTHLSERLLLLARLDDGSVPMERVRLHDVIDKALSVTAQPAELKSMTLNKKVQASDAEVIGDATSLTELLVILLDNAIKYSSANTAVTLTARKDAKHISIAIADKGQGIADEHLAHIFDRFYRVDTARTGGEAHGYGLGLALAQKIAHLHGGDIAVKSKEGKGSTFTVTLPLA